MKVVAFLTGYEVVDRIIRHLELTFVAEKPPPAHIFEQVALMAAPCVYAVVGEGLCCPTLSAFQSKKIL